MTWLADNALVIWMGGALALTTAAVIYFQTRTGRALLSVVVVLLITAALLGVEHFIETPREAIERSLYQLAANVEANDVAGTIAFLSPAADKNLRQDVEELMPLVQIERARITGTPQITVEESDEPDSATVVCDGIVVATIKRTGMKGGQRDELTMQWVRVGDRWLLESYTSGRNWHRALGR